MEKTLLVFVFAFEFVFVFVFVFSFLPDTDLKQFVARTRLICAIERDKPDCLSHYHRQGHHCPWCSFQQSLLGVWNIKQFSLSPDSPSPRCRVAEVVEAQKRWFPKSEDLSKRKSPHHTLFYCEFHFCSASKKAFRELSTEVIMLSERYQFKFVCAFWKVANFCHPATLYRSTLDMDWWSVEFFAGAVAIMHQLCE